MSAPERRRAARLVGLVAALAIVFVNVGFVVAAAEDWPFTSAPMYAHAVTPDGPRVRFLVRRPDGKPVVLKGKLSNLWVWRSFWKHSWRDPETRQARVSAFLGMLAANQAQPPDALDLYLEERRFDGERDRVTEKIRLARWTPGETRIFEDKP